MTLSSPLTLQALPPRWARFCLDIERFCRDELHCPLEGKSLVVGFSGGLDSTALLLVCACLTVRGGGSVTAAHLDHGLRPESGDDCRAAGQVCENLGIPFVFRHVNVAALARAQGLGIEEAARTARLSFLDEVRTQNGCDLTALAHHRDDLAEDVLLRLVRGAGWPGLGGMEGLDPQRRIIRPLLGVGKAQLKKFLEEIGLPWREDETNVQPLYRRNRLRLAVMPALAEENPALSQAVARLWQQARLDRDYWDIQLAQYLPLPGATTLHLPRGLLLSMHPAMRLRLYKAVLDSLGPGQALFDTLADMDRALAEGRERALFQLPGEKTATLTPEGLDFAAATPQKP